MVLENVCGLPVAILDNFYNEEECKKIWQELEFLNNDSEKFGGAEKTGSAWKTIEGEKVLLKKNRGVFLDNVYQRREFSNILKINRKFFSSENLTELIESHVIFRYISESNKDSTLVQYYENSDHYGLHGDNAIITSIIWFYQKPKAFSGGSIFFENGLKIECLYNRMIVFPSILKHEVEEVKLGENLLNQNYGRYSITQFANIENG